MTVHIVTDSSACLPPALAAEYDITVLDFHAEGEGEEETTAGLGSLELTACYARLLERGGDDGVVAIHISKELSGTWSSACQAAAVLGDGVEVLDTQSGGMVIGQAAIAAARRADEGGTLDECRGAAQHVIDTGHLWLFLGKMDSMARGGRLSAGQRLLSTALAIRPILHLSAGKLELAAKTRTQAKAMDRLVSLSEQEYREAAEALVEGDDADADSDAAGEDAAESEADSGQASGEADATDATDAEEGEDTGDTGDTESAEESGESEESAESDDDASGTDDGAEDGADKVVAAEHRPGIFHFAGRDKSDKADKTDKAAKADKAEKSAKGDKGKAAKSETDSHRRRTEEQTPLDELPRVPMHLAVHHHEAEDVAEKLRSSLREALPECVVISVVDITHSMAVHTGPGAVGISLVRD